MKFMNFYEIQIFQTNQAERGELPWDLFVIRLFYQAIHLNQRASPKTLKLKLMQEK